MTKVQERLEDLIKEVGCQQATVDYMVQSTIPKEVARLRSLKKDLQEAMMYHGKECKDWLDPLIEKSLRLLEMEDPVRLVVGEHVGMAVVSKPFPSTK